MNSRVIIIFLSLILTSSFCFSQSSELEKKQIIVAKSFIKGTYNVVKAAGTAKKANKKKPKSEEPFLGLAYDYQKKAVELYNDKMLESAINHSLKARKLAMMSIKQQNGKIQDNHHVIPDVAYKHFEKDLDFYKEVKSNMKDLKTPEMSSIDNQLTTDIGLSTEDPKIADLTIFKALETLSNIR